MAEPESAEYQGRRRAPVPALRGTVLVAGGIGVAVLVLLSLVVIVLTAPQKPRVPAVGQPAAPPTPAAPDGSSPAGRSPTAARPSPSPSPSLSLGPSASPSRSPSRSPSPAPSAPTSQPPALPPPLQPVSYEAEASGNVLFHGARVAPMGGASGAAGVYALGAPNGGMLVFGGIAGGGGGRYTVTVYFQNPDRADRAGRMTVNSGAPVTLRYPSTGPASVASTSVGVVLTAGTGNTIVLDNLDSRAADVDRIVVAPS